ncbi:MAG: alanine/glycine:cation symporter family protein [Peptoniphilaceae bacterium]|jgi:AGCS family alanine or glycine:cation symporter
METLNTIVTAISDVVWFPILVVALVGLGAFSMIYLGFPQFTRFGKSFQQTFGGMFKKKEEGEVTSMSSFQALATAIAAQVGTGNVAGVATAIFSGGPGAIFWMWMSALFGMSTIFSEAILAQKYREVKDGEYIGGPAYYMSKGLKFKGNKAMAAFFALSLIIALGLIGNLVQSNSISGAVTQVTSLPPIAIGVILAVMAALVFIGGMKRIARFAELVVPFMALLYIVGAVAILIRYGDMVVPTLKSIFVGAFNPQAIGGGAAGVAVQQAIRFGVARGLFSNEAGMGSTPHAHATANVKHPVQQGLVAMVGVVIDTGVVCTATALIILVTGAHESGLQAAMITQEAFARAFGNGGAIFLAISLTFFAFTTIIGWYYFGEANVRYLFGNKALTPYRILVCLFIIIGSSLTGQIDLVWNLADMFNGIMVLPNLIALLVLLPQVKALVKDYDAQVRLDPKVFD